MAGEKGREYVLVKNDGVEGGWALGVVSNEGAQEQPIDVDKPTTSLKDQEDDSDVDEDFEDIPIEGLNRLPKKQSATARDDAVSLQRKAFYDSRRQATRRKPRLPPQTDDPNSLFVAEESSEGEIEDCEDVDPDGDLFGEPNQQTGEDEDADLRRAIAMSLEQNADSPDANEESERSRSEEARNEMLDAFQQSAAEEARPVPHASARAIASLLNQRAFKNAPESRETTSFGVPVARKDESEDEDDVMDLQAAFAESRRDRRKVVPVQRRQSHITRQNQERDQPDHVKNMSKKAGFSGPLPFEKLDLGSSLLGKKKMEQRTEEAAGGFENPELATKKQKAAEPLPPWFSGDIEDDLRRQKALELEDRERMKAFNKQFQFHSRDEPLQVRGNNNEVIDLDAEEEPKGFRPGEIIDLETAEEDKMLRGNPSDAVDSRRCEAPVPLVDSQPPPPPQTGEPGPFQAEGQRRRRSHRGGTNECDFTCANGRTQ